MEIVLVISVVFVYPNMFKLFQAAHMAIHSALITRTSCFLNTERNTLQFYLIDIRTDISMFTIRLAVLRLLLLLLLLLSLLLLLLLRLQSELVSK